MEISVKVIFLCVHIYFIYVHCSDATDTTVKSIHLVWSQICAELSEIPNTSSQL